MRRRCPGRRCTPDIRIRGLCALQIACCAAARGDWQPGTLVQDTTSPNAFKGNPCGYPDFSPTRWPYRHTAAVSPDNILPYACGSCVEIAANSSEFKSFAVQVTNFCRECDSNTIQLPKAARTRLSALAPGNRIAITYRQVACDPPGNLSLQLDMTPAGNLVVHPLEVAGAGSISAMDVRAAGTGDGGWLGMSFVATGTFKLFDPPHTPVDFRITPQAGEAVTLLNVTKGLLRNGTFGTSGQAGKSGWPTGPGIQITDMGSIFAGPSQLPGSPLPTLPSSGPEAFHLANKGIQPLQAPSAPPAPSPEEVAASDHAAEVAQTLLQRQEIGLGDAVSQHLPLCVPVSIGQLSQCVPVMYSAGGPAPQPSTNTPGSKGSQAADALPHPPWVDSAEGTEPTDSAVSASPPAQSILAQLPISRTPLSAFAGQQSGPLLPINLPPPATQPPSLAPAQAMPLATSQSPASAPPPLTQHSLLADLPITFPSGLAKQGPMAHPTGVAADLPAMTAPQEATARQAGSKQQAANPTSPVCTPAPTKPMAGCPQKATPMPPGSLISSLPIVAAPSLTINAQPPPFPSSLAMASAPGPSLAEGTTAQSLSAGVASGSLQTLSAGGGELSSGFSAGNRSTPPSREADRAPPRAESGKGQREARQTDARGFAVVVSPEGEHTASVQTQWSPGRSRLSPATG